MTDYAALKKMQDQLDQMQGRLDLAAQNTAEALGGLQQRVEHLESLLEPPAEPAPKPKEPPKPRPEPHTIHLLVLTPERAGRGHYANATIFDHEGQGAGERLDYYTKDGILDKTAFFARLKTPECEGTWLISIPVRWRNGLWVLSVKNAVLSQVPTGITTLGGARKHLDLPEPEKAEEGP